MHQALRHKHHPLLSWEDVWRPDCVRDVPCSSLRERLQSRGSVHLYIVDSCALVGCVGFSYAYQSDGQSTLILSGSSNVCGLVTGEPNSMKRIPFLLRDRQVAEGERVHLCILTVCGNAATRARIRVVCDHSFVVHGYASRSSQP